jgi:hypothetical protein
MLKTLVRATVLGLWIATGVQAACEHDLSQLPVAPDVPLRQECVMEGFLESDGQSGTVLHVRPAPPRQQMVVACRTPTGESLTDVMRALHGGPVRVALRGLWTAEGGYAPRFVVFEVTKNGTSMPFLKEDIDRMKNAAVLAVRQRYASDPDLKILGTPEVSVGPFYHMTVHVKSCRGILGRRYNEEFLYRGDTGELQFILGR